MAALSFKKQLAPDVKSGKKRQTIRQTRKDIHPGKALQLYTGMRTKQCTKIGDSVCITVVPIAIFPDGSIALGGEYLPERAREAFAKADGFDGLAAFLDFFRTNYGLPFGTDDRGACVYYWGEVT